MKRGLLLNCFVIILTVFAFYSDVFATITDWSYDNCIKESGNRGNISSVRWVCKNKKADDEATGNNVNYCTLWVGGSDSSNLVINVTSLSGEQTAYYYGMCTTYADKTSRITVTNDNDAVDDAKNFTRSGTWGTPSFLATNINVAKFVDGIDRVENGKYYDYTRTINVERCNGENTSSCSNENDTLTVRIKRDDLYEAKIEVTDNMVSKDKTSILGWTSKDDSMTKYIRCDDLSCSVTYKHLLRQIEGEDEVFSYTIIKNDEQVIAQGDSIPGKDGIEVRNATITNIKPGNTYSERLDLENNNITLTATVIAPYNFDNEVCLGTLENGECKEDTVEEIVYAGETASIQSSVIIGDRWNQTVGESYATSVPNAKTELRVRYDDGELYNITEELGTIAKGANNGNRNTSINVRDLPAGTKFTVQFCLYPKSSIYDTNITTNFGDDWSCSNEKNFIIAKKPSFQVWGSGLYSAGKINIPIAKKTNIANNNKYPYGIQNSNDIISFGSWIELGLIVDNTVEGLASGAGMGYNATSDAENPSATPNNLGGGSESFCKISTLTIPNVGCSNNKIGSSKSNSANASNASSDKSALISRFADESAGYEKIELDGDTVDGMTIIKSETKVIDAGDKTITITDNIVYQDDSNDKYTSLAEIPKLIIYANNIKIACNVTRIDAVLIANYDINTCVDDNGNTPDLNSKQRSNQLIINGSVITDTIHLNRTYGAATGNNSIIPAEIINYDSSLYLWTNRESKSVKTGKIVTSYQQELPPRY